MFSPKTVFIVGAGASCDFGLPTGDQLREEISKTLKTLLSTTVSLNDPFIRAVHNASIQNGDAGLREYEYAAHRLLAALPLAISIDNLLHAHRHDHRMVLIGKLAIFAVVLSKERSSPLFNASRQMHGSIARAEMNTPALAKSWYLPLMRLLGMGKRLDQLPSLFENVAFIVWNYDRCLEHFLATAIIDYFNVDANAAISAIETLQIVHPYGVAGRLPWQTGTGPVAQFGDDSPPLREIADSILTFTESAEEGVREQARDLIQNAQTLVSMGFGFLPQNMSLLTVTHPSSVERVFATTLNIGDDDVAIVEAEISEMIKCEAWYQGRLSFNAHGEEDAVFRFYTERGTCRELMDHNWLRLTRD
jgi:hypothetical protein